MALLEVRNLQKVYTTRFGAQKVQALSNVTFTVEKGEFVAIMGYGPCFRRASCSSRYVLPGCYSDRVVVIR